MRRVTQKPEHSTGYVLEQKILRMDKDILPLEVVAGRAVYIVFYFFFSIYINTLRPFS